MTDIKIKIEDKEILNLAKKLQDAKGDMNSALLNMGEALHNETIKRMEQEKSPDGQSWEKLNSDYAAGKKSSKKLQEQGASSGLLGSLHYTVSGNVLEYGSPKIYAAIHQFGGTIKPVNGKSLAFMIGGKTVFAKSVTIPARPYLGVGSNERDAMLDVLGDHLKEIFAKN